MVDIIVSAVLISPEAFNCTFMQNFVRTEVIVVKPTKIHFNVTTVLLCIPLG